MSGRHRPVLLDEVLAVLEPRDGGIYVDGTFGGGGYSRAILDRAQCRVIAIDRDPDAIARGRALAEEYSGRLTLVAGRFSEMDEILRETAGETANGVALDVGVSSYQLDDAARGFSFQCDGPLDMRMECEGPSAADIVNSVPEEELAGIIRRYGEERRARSVARAIVAARPVTRTGQLAEIVTRALGPAARRDPLHPATRTFQALRIQVNDELHELERGLEAAERALAPKGRLAVVAFHSLEDRIVKHFLAERSGTAPRGSRHAPAAPDERRPSFRLLGRAARRPGAAEIAANPRARSARLRAAERSSAPPWNREAGARP